jgi:hypothetical protein
MSSEVEMEVDRALATVTAAINDQKLDEFDADRVQKIVTASLGGVPALTVDNGGGLHDETGARLGVIRRTGSGEWIIERQNNTADQSHTAVPTQPTWSRVRKLLTTVSVRG